MELSSKYGKIGEEMMSPDYRKDFATFLFCFDFLLLFLFLICCFCRIFSLSFFKLGVVCFFLRWKKAETTSEYNSGSLSPTSLAKCYVYGNGFLYTISLQSSTDVQICVCRFAFLIKIPKLYSPYFNPFS